MELWEHVLLPLIGLLAGIIASSGFWAYLIKKDSKNDERDAKEEARDEMLLGLGHDRIMYLSEKFIYLGEITADEYENLNTYLYTPYMKMGGNGSAKRNMEKVYKLEVKSARLDQRELPKQQHKSSNIELQGENES